MASWTAAEIIGGVFVEADAQLSGSRIVGPVIVGAELKVTGVVCGPFAAIAGGRTADDCEIEHSTVLSGA
jgi:glucose-1-phosphate thymidylyltransferase